MRALWKTSKYYLIYVCALLGLYSWTGVRGISYFGDDNIHKKDGQRHTGMGGHGIYYHK